MFLIKFDQFPQATSHHKTADYGDIHCHDEEHSTDMEESNQNIKQKLFSQALQNRWLPRVDQILSFLFKFFIVSLSWVALLVAFNFYNLSFGYLPSVILHFDIGQEIGKKTKDDYKNTNCKELCCGYVFLVEFLDDDHKGMIIHTDEYIYISLNRLIQFVQWINNFLIIIIRDFLMRPITKSFIRLAKTLPKPFHTLKFVPTTQLFVPKTNLLTHNVRYNFSMANHESVSKGAYTGDGFYVEQLLTGCLSIYSYYIESNGEAFLIDPMNQIQKYEKIINERGSKLKGVFLTHYHADYIAGHIQLQRKFNSNIYMGPTALETYGIKVLKDNEQIQLGDIKLQLVHTPGHTEESSCLLMHDKNNQQACLFTGDTMFLNEVGRPDLAVKTDLTVKDLASMLYNSIQKIKKLDDNLRIYPGHGAGSSCGKAIGKGDFCTLGTQKQNNYALKANNQELFINEILQGMPTPPQYFGYDANINKFNPFDYNEVQKIVMNKLSAAEVKKLVKDNATIIDIRTKEQLEEGMIPGAVTIDFEGAFASWLGTLFPPKRRYIVYGKSEEKVKETIKRMLRIGYINIEGYCTEPVDEMKKSFDVYKPDFVGSVVGQGYTVLDVRKPGQWKKGVVSGATKFELSNLFNNGQQLDKNKKYIVHCQSGYRARIGYSYLKNHGFNAKAFIGEFASIEKSGVKIQK